MTTNHTSTASQFFLLCLLLLFGCSSPQPGPIADEVAPAATRQVPPTFTPLVPAFPQPPPANTQAPQPTAASGSPTPRFDENVVELRYSIPALALDRRLQGNVASQITLVDEATGQSRQRSNQVSILLELQQTLSALELVPLPDGCNACVHIEYRLPLSDAAASGWLQDPVLLASVENFTAVLLGPHFPPDTVLALRRSASPFTPAHTVAMTADGRLWRWLATDAVVADPAAADPVLSALLDEVPVTALAEEYVANCLGSPVETLFLNTAQGTGQVSIVCPEFTLPSTLLPLYLQLDAALAPLVADVSLPRPPTAMPLAALLDYRRDDGARLTLYQDGAAVAVAADSTVYSETLGITQILTVTTALLASGELQPGLHTFTGRETGTATPSAPTSTLLVRSPEGVYDGLWPGAAIPALDQLNLLLNTLIGQPAAEPEAVATPAAPLAETPISVATPSPVAPPSP